MEQMIAKGLRSNSTGIFLLLLLSLLLISNHTFATDYTVTGSAPGTINPTTLGANPPVPATPTSTGFSNGDTLTVESGCTMATPSTSAQPYTIGIFSPSPPALFSITVNKNATLSYGGSNGSGAAIYTSRSGVTTTTENITINGSVTAGTGEFAIQLTNSGGATNDTYTINIGTISTSAAVVSGAIFTSGVANVTLNVTGTPSTSGTINLAVKTGGVSTMNVGAGGVTTYTPVGALQNIGTLHITNNSTMTQNITTSSIGSLVVDTGSTYNVESVLNGLSSSDGGILNNGTMYITANIAKTGAFSAPGSSSNVIVGENITVSTSNFNVYKYTALLTDIGNYGQVTLNNTSGTVAFTASNFVVQNGGGYFPGGTLTLVTSEANITTTPTYTVPASTLFLNFGTPSIVNGNTIQITLTRTPFTAFATNSLTQTIASNLETLGANSPSSSMLSLLDAVEASTSGGAVEYALQSLAPLADAPFYTYDVQNDTMDQVQLRLASIHNNTGNYFAGDIAQDNHLWIRPFGAYANQKAKDDSLGFYATSGGIVGGFDRNLDDNYTVGAAFGYVLSHVNDKVNQQSVTNVSSYIGMVYGSYNFTDTRFLDWIIAVTANNFTANRLVDINGQYIQTATSSYGSQQISARGLWSENFAAFGFMMLTPEALAQYTFSKQYTYQESGAPGANLNISRANSDIITLGLGGKAAVPIWVDPSIALPEIHGWGYYNPVIGKQDTIFNFIDGGGSMTSILNLSRTGLLIGAALTIAVVDKMEIKLNFDYNVADRFSGYVAYLNLRYLL